MRALAVLTVVLFVAALGALGIFIAREINTEQRVTEVQTIGSPCRTAKNEALNARGSGGYWEAIRSALHNNECAEQADLVIWSYCIRHHIPANLCDLPDGLRPDRPNGDGDREGGDADQSAPQGHGLPGGSKPPDLPPIDLPPLGPPPGNPHNPPPAPDPLEDVTEAVCEVWPELMPPSLPDPLAPVLCP